MSMNAKPSALPPLTVNRLFMQALLKADAPCCGLGLVEVDGRQCGFLALRSGEHIPNEITNGGFNLGHSLYGGSFYEAIHFAFEFYNFQRYHVLVNPNNPVVKTVLQTMLESGDYFFFAIDERFGSVTAFRAELGYDVLLNIKTNWDLIQQSTTTEPQYDLLLKRFANDSTYPPGKFLTWVCRDDLSYLDLSTHRWELKPSTS